MINLTLETTTFKGHKKFKNLTSLTWQLEAIGSQDQPLMEDSQTTKVTTLPLHLNFQETIRKIATKIMRDAT